MDPFGDHCGVPADVEAAMQSVGPVISKAHQVVAASMTPAARAEKMSREGEVRSLVMSLMAMHRFACPASVQVERQITTEGASFRVTMAAHGQQHAAAALVVEDMALTLTRLVATEAELMQMCSTYVAAMEALGLSHIAPSWAPTVEGT